MQCHHCNNKSSLVTKKVGLHDTSSCPFNSTPCIICQTDHTLSKCDVFNRKCFACGKYGHLVINCPSSLKNTKVCYSCQRPDHIARNCPFFESKDDRLKCNICMNKKGVKSKCCSALVCVECRTEILKMTEPKCSFCRKSL